MNKIFIKKINPRNYDYIWSDCDINYIFVSCYLFENFRKTDFILIYDHKNKELKFFLSKKDRKRLSDYGLVFYKNKFSAWKEKTLNYIKIGKKLIQETKNDKSRVKLMNLNEIKNKILQRVNLFQGLGNNYFYTEFFFLDKIEQLKIGKQSILAKNLKEMASLKFKARDTLNYFYNYKKIFAPYIEELKRRTRRDDLDWLGFEEIYKVIDGKKVKKSNRKNRDWIIAKSTKWNEISGVKVVSLIKRFNNYFFNKNIKVFKGVVANKGIRKGHVKIINVIFSDKILAEIKKVQKGDVLVAQTTGPEIITACRKAGAIVTDEGGLTSHAAIVSRELGIPCVVGTKIASKVLKDGDLVEVDANKGVVKILKRK